MTIETILSTVLLVAQSAAGDIHPAHDKVKGGCAACHVETKKEDACGPIPGGWKKITRETCAGCHKTPPEFQPGPDIPAAITFGHGAHKVSAARCKTCHEIREGRMTLSAAMYDCVSCHEAEGRRTTCSGCHPKKAGDAGIPGAEPRPALKSLLPKTGMPGLGHGPGWAEDHGKVAVARTATCRECHDDKKCASCHLGSNRRLAYHTADWVAVHGIAAKKKTSDCGACHAYTRFCLGCHQRAGAAADGKPGAATRTAHPAGWNAAVRGPSHHAFAAQKDISSCASCHQEGSCTKCHATKGRGGRGYNPHSAGFAADCGTYLSRNEDACFKCHQRSDLKKKCLPGVQILPPR